VVWEASLEPKHLNVTAMRFSVADALQRSIEELVRRDPGQVQHTLDTPFCTVTARRTSNGNGHGPCGPILVKFTEGATTKPITKIEAGGVVLPVLALPDDSTLKQGQMLVGLDDIRTRVVRTFECLWDSRAEVWAQRHSAGVRRALCNHLAGRHALLLFIGDPGVGKSVLASAVADEYARQAGVSGYVAWLHTEVRGTGMVGEFSNRLRSAFRALDQLPDEAVRVLLLDEADTLCMKRTTEQSHHEEQVGTGTLIQILDEIAGRRRLAVIMTTNVRAAVDPAIMRRAFAFEFPRPDAEARRILVRRWLPDEADAAIDDVVQRLDGMTPADIDRVCLQACVTAIDLDAPLAVELVLASLSATRPTDAV